MVTPFPGYMKSVYINNNKLDDRSYTDNFEEGETEEVYNEYNNYNSIRANNKNKKTEQSENGLID